MAMCRACLELLPEDTHNLFQDKELAVRFVECTSLTVDPYDIMPENLCDNCHEMLLKFSGFQKMCAESVAKFSKLTELMDDLTGDVHGNIEDIYILLHGSALDSKEEEIQFPNNDSTNNDTFTETAESHPLLDGDAIDAIDDQVLDERIIQEEIYLFNGGAPALTEEEIQFLNNNINNTFTETAESHPKIDDQLLDGLIIHDLIEEVIQLPNIDSTNNNTSTVAAKSLVKNNNPLLDGGIIQDEIYLFNGAPPDLIEEETQFPNNNTLTETSEKSLPKSDNILLDGRIIKEEIYSFNGDAADLIEEEIQLSNNDSTNNNTLNETSESLPKIEDKLLSSLRCTICEKRFYKLDRLRAHMCTHQGVKPYTCTECGRAYTRAESLGLHMREVHLQERKSYKCTVGGCGKEYRAKRSLVHHVVEHHTSNKKLSESTCVCETCGKVFSRRAQLTIHRYTHMDESQYRFGCEQCGKRFYLKASLVDHIKRHAQIKCFSCDICGAGKVSRAELKEHMNSHTFEKAWGCRVCDKIYSSLGNLTKHIKTVHECKRNYACRYCNASFAKMYTLQTHEMRHTNTKPHKCQFCPREFIQKGSLNSHIKRMHSKEVMKEI